MLGIYGSPRVGGNSELLLDVLLAGAEEGGASVERLYLRNYSYRGCIACGECDKTGQCVLRDDMREIYPVLKRNRVIMLAMPMFFYGPPAIAKAFMDRAQALWCARALERPPAEWGQHQQGNGYLLGVGATKGEKLFVPSELIVRYFFDALDMDYKGGMFFRGLDAKGAVLQKPEFLENARQWGEYLAQNG